MSTRSGAEVVPRDPEAQQEAAEGGEGEADDGVRVALDGGDEWCAEGVDGERPGDVEWLPRGDVGVDLGFADVSGEGDARARDFPVRAVRATAAVVDEPVAGVEGSGAAALQHPPLPRYLWGVGFAVDDAVEFEGGVAAEDEPVEFARIVACGDGLGLGAGEQLHEVERAGASRGLDGGGLVDVGGGDDGFDPRGAQGREPGR